MPCITHDFAPTVSPELLKCRHCPQVRKAGAPDVPLGFDDAPPGWDRGALDYPGAFRIALMKAAVEHDRKGEPFTSEDVTAIVGMPTDADGSEVGSLMRAAWQEGLIRKVGQTSARRENQHGATITTWRLVK